MQEELSTYADEVFESPSEMAIKEVDSGSKKDEKELTGSALDKTELERSHLMLWVTVGKLLLELYTIELKIVSWMSFGEL